MSGKFWARDGTEYVHPLALELDLFADWDLPMQTPSRESAEQRLDRVGLITGQRIACVFDFGDEWRVRLTLREIVAADGDVYPRVLESVGDAPPQYPDYEEDAALPQRGFHAARRCRMRRWQARAWTARSR